MIHLWFFFGSRNLTLTSLSKRSLKVCGGLCVQDPVIHEIFPTFGPKSGNTMLTIRGAFLDTGNKREVTIGKAVCKIQRSVHSLFFILSFTSFLFLFSFPRPLHNRKRSSKSSLHVKPFSFFLHMYCRGVED